MSKNSVRHFRQLRRMTQAELAAAIGVSKSDISRWERGANLRSDNLKKLADTLGVDAGWLLSTPPTIDDPSPASEST